MPQPAALRSYGRRLPPSLRLALGLAIAIGAAYAPALTFGAFWDDPLWFRQGQGQSLLELFAGTPQYQFYRPLMLAYNRLWWLPDGRLNLFGLHAVQIALHTAVSWLSYLFARQSGLTTGWAMVCAGIVAFFPFSHQAVAWAQAQQPLVTALLLVALLSFAAAREQSPASAQRRAKERRGALYVLSLAAYGLALWLNEVAVAFGPVFPLVGCLLTGRAIEPPSPLGAAGCIRPSSLAVPPPQPARRLDHQALGLAAPHLALALAYLLLRQRAQLLPGIAGRGYEPEVAAFLGQAILWPIARIVAAMGAAWPVPALLALWVTAGSGLAMGLWRCGARRQLSLGAMLTLSALLPVWAGLPYRYVELGQRLVYPAVPGIALLWATLLAVAWSRTSHRWGGRKWLVAAAGFLVASMASDLWQQHRLYVVGTQHLAQATVALRDPTSRPIFINFPDRLALRRSPYPLGYWGITLAPVVVELDEYAHLEYARAGRSECWSVPRVGAAERDAWAYRVDMRGVAIETAQLVQRARRATAVYLSQYGSNGELQLLPVGSLTGCGLSPRPLARLGAAVTLAEATVLDGTLRSRNPDRRATGDKWVSLRLCWQRHGTLDPGQTVFVHLFGPHGRQVAGADGDAWSGLLPLAAWPSDELVEDLRRLDLAELGPGDYRLTVGIYERATNRRLVARSAVSGQRYPDDEVPVAQLRLGSGLEILVTAPGSSEEES